MRARHDELGRLGRPKDNVDALAGQFVADGIDTRTANADTGALRIDALVVGFDGDFGTLARVAGDSADFKHAVCNFRYFIGVQFDEEIAGSTAQDDLFAVGVADFFDAQEEGADAVAAAEVFARNHLVARNQRVQFASTTTSTMMPWRSTRLTVPDTMSSLTARNSFRFCSRSASRMRCRMICLAVCAAWRPKRFVGQLLFVVFADLDGSAGNFLLDFLDGFSTSG